MLPGSASLTVPRAAASPPSSPLQVFIPEERWGPMSHLPLAQEALRCLLDRALGAAEALAADPGNARVAARLAGLWDSFATVNTYYSKLKVGVRVLGVNSGAP